MSQARAYAAQDPTSGVAPFTFTRRALRDDDVRIDIKYCGICASDLHQVRNEWKNSIYPMVPGHEIVGHVAAIGPKVTKFKVGDVVGVGCMVDSCLKCGQCAAKQEQFCEEGATFTYNAKEKDGVTIAQGGYSDHIVVRQDFVVSVPTSLPLAAAAPLLCAGITTYSPLRRWGVKAGDKVGVVGLGGLGTMAVKLAKAMGAHVTVFTSSEHKRSLAAEIGADDVVVTSNADDMGRAQGLRVVVDTVAVSHDLNPVLSKLGVDGTYVLVGAPENPHPPVMPMALIFGRRSVAGSLIGGVAETQEMLNFCAEHNITCEIELIKIQKVNEAYERMRKSDVKGRFVIDMASLTQDA